MKNPYPRKRSSEEGNYNPRSSQESIQPDEVDHLGKRDFSGMEFENEEFGSNKRCPESDVIERLSETNEESTNVKKKKKRGDGKARRRGD